MEDFLRATRNKLYSDEAKSYYHDRYKRLQYLANDFGINYQPRVMVFVEGQTEEYILPKIFRDRFGNIPENHGIEFQNLNGISNFFGTEVKPRQSDGRYVKKVIGNFSSLLSYNLDKWQIIPFLIGDNENRILNLLMDGKCLLVGGMPYKLPSKWCYIWGQDPNFSTTGKDFELVNFTSLELVNAIIELNPSIIVSESDIDDLRTKGYGLKQLSEPAGKMVDDLKINLAERLYRNLKKKYEDSGNQEILRRPVFSMLDYVVRLAALNHAPHNREQELANQHIIHEIIRGSRLSW